MTWTRETEAEIHPPDKPYCSRLPSCSQRLWPKFDDYLRGRKLNHALARANNWYPSRTVDGYDRAVVTTTSDQPGNLYWQARLLGALGSAPPLDLPEGVRRWESPHGIARGNAVCMVWPDQKNGRSVVVEGPMDALAAAELGFLAVGLMGVTPAIEVLDLTSRLLRGTVCLVVPDQHATKPMAMNLIELGSRGLKCHLITHPFKDLADAAPAARRRILDA